MDIFYCEYNLPVAAIVGGATAVLSILMVVLAKLFKDKAVIYFTAGALICTVVSTLFCYHPIVLAGYIISIICLGLLMTQMCRVAHKNTIYKLSPLHLFSKIIIPISIFFQAFRPYFVWCSDETQSSYYNTMAGLGLNAWEVETRSIAGFELEYENVLGINAYNYFIHNDWKDFNLMGILTLLLFVVVLVMQGLIIWRQFKDPDNARDWADIGLIVTCIGSIFLYGMFTSTNFGLVEQSFVENVSLTIPVMVVLGVLNRVLYFEKVEMLLDKISGKIFKKA